MKLRLSPLGHTWILDLDGTVVKHNGHLEPDGDSLLPGAAEFMKTIPEEDMVVFLTSRDAQYEEATRVFLDANCIRYDRIIFNVPFGERVLVNDKKPSGLLTAFAVNKTRDGLFYLDYEIDETL